MGNTENVFMEGFAVKYLRLPTVNYANDSIKIVHAQEGDFSSRYICVSMYDDRGTIDLSSYTSALFCSETPDGNKRFTAEGITINYDDNSIMCKIPSFILSQEGRTSCNIILNANADFCLTSRTFYVQVSRSQIISGEDVEEETGMSIAEIIFSIKDLDSKYINKETFKTKGDMDAWIWSEKLTAEEMTIPNGTFVDAGNRICVSMDFELVTVTIDGVEQQVIANHPTGTPTLYDITGNPVNVSWLDFYVENSRYVIVSEPLKNEFEVAGIDISDVGFAFNDDGSTDGKNIRVAIYNGDSAADFSYDHIKTHHIALGTQFHIGEGNTTKYWWNGTAAVLDETDGGVGEETVGGGEIFNDYESNNAVSFLSHAEGSSTQAGSKAYSLTYIDAYENEGVADETGTIIGKYYLNTDEGLQAIASAVTNAGGDRNKMPPYTVVLDSNYDYRGVVIAADIGNKTITVTNYVKPTTSGATAIDSDSYLLLPTFNYGDKVIGEYAHAEGDRTKAEAQSAHAEGRQSIAAGKYGHAEGRETVAAYAAHSEGRASKALGEHSHSEGNGCIASGGNSHAQGEKTTASGKDAHSQGYMTKASGSYSSAGGMYAEASGTSSSSFGRSTKATGTGSIATGQNSVASGENASAHGMNTTASAKNQFVVGAGNEEDDDAIFIVGISNTSYHKNGFVVKKTGDSYVGGDVYAKGKKLLSVDDEVERYAKESITKDSIAKGAVTEDKISDGSIPYAKLKDPIGRKPRSDLSGEVFNDYANNEAGELSHAEGSNNKVYGATSHAEGRDNTINGVNGHAEGQGNIIAEGVWSGHAEGHGGEVYAQNAHTGGMYCKAYAKHSIAHGFYLISGDESSPNGSDAMGQAVFGMYNLPDVEAIFIVGNGSAQNRNNALAVKKDGRLSLGADPAEKMDAVTKSFLDTQIRDVESGLQTILDALNEALGKEVTA